MALNTLYARAPLRPNCKSPLLMMPSNAFEQEIVNLPVWTMRLAQEPQVRARLLAQPMVFGSWYAVTGEVLSWPQEVQEIQAAERLREVSFERALELLEKMNAAFQGPAADLEQAREMLEAYAVHEWVRKNPSEFDALLDDALKNWGALSQRALRGGRAPSKLNQLVQALGFSALHAQLLTLAVLCTAARSLDNALQQLTRERGQQLALWSHMLGCASEELEEALSPRSPLVCAQILRSPESGRLVPRVSAFWVKLLAGVESSLFDALLQPLRHRSGAGLPAQLSELDESIALQLIGNAKEPGVNLLLYGAEGLDRRAAVEKLLRASNLEGYVLQNLDAPWSDMPSLHFVAQRLLHAKHGERAVLVIERSTEVLERRPSELLRQLFDLQFDESQLRPFDELMLQSNPAPCIWVGPGSDRLSPECVARMVFHAPLTRAKRQERQRLLQQTLEELKLGKSVQKELLGLEEVSGLQLQTAVRSAKLAGLKRRSERDTYVLQAIKRSLAALQRKTRSSEKECVTQYSLRYVNYAGRFGPEQILKAMTLRPRGSLCLYGPPGTGKTQFVEHLSQSLGLRLHSYRASDLLSKYVGENEQNIAKMFQDAANEDCVLFIDEADSFLRDRTLAQHSWEVTKVNELLQHMERFEGIFVVATNLFNQLDLAALRRFTFKLEFLALRAEQRWEMFVNEAGLKGKLSQHSASLRDQWLTELCLMPQLTAGDFAVVKRQALLLGLELAPKDWLDQLKVECELKSRAS